MRTDHLAGRTDRSGERAVGVSRRTVLRAGGAVAGAGVLDAGRSAASEPAEPLRIAATGPYLASVRALVDDVGPDLDADVRVERAESGGDSIDGAAGVDVHVSGRPVLDESARSDAVADAVAVSGWAQLASPAEWREPLVRSAVRAHWTGDEPVETWSEADRESLAAGVGTDTPTAAGSDDSDADPTVLARGTRAAQYSQGHGGEAYYGVDADAIEALPDDGAVADDETGADDATAADDETGADDATAADDAPAADDGRPLARLEYVHVAPGAGEEERVERLLGAYERRAVAATEAGANFVDPAVERADR